MKSENKGSAKVMAWGGGPVMTSVQIGGRGLEADQDMGATFDTNKMSS